MQFCANDPDTFLEASKLAEPLCDGIDLNLGCPQSIARRGNYGAFLQEEWDLVYRIGREHRQREWWRVQAQTERMVACAYTQTERMVACLYTDRENGGVLIHRHREWWCAYTQT